MLVITWLFTWCHPQVNILTIIFLKVNLKGTCWSLLTNNLIKHRFWLLAVGWRLDNVCAALSASATVGPFKSKQSCPLKRKKRVNNCWIKVKQSTCDMEVFTQHRCIQGVVPQSDSNRSLSLTVRVSPPPSRAALEETTSPTVPLWRLPERRFHNFQQLVAAPFGGKVNGRDRASSQRRKTHQRGGKSQKERGCLRTS